MPNQYSSVRRNWSDLDTKADLIDIWTRERFEANITSIEEALRTYEMAIRVDGWEAVKEWAWPLMNKNRILNAQLVELSMRALEQGDVAFFNELSEHLLDTSPPNYFRFWQMLFSIKHSHTGERVFREQLTRLSDYQIVKYRRHVRKIFRKLRFRCKTDRERAIGNIAFAMYEKYDAKEYPSKEFQALIACQKVATNRGKTKLAKPLPVEKQMEQFTKAAKELGIWSVVEGIRTSSQLPRTLSYLAFMAENMSDNELLKSLKAFDKQLINADHKKASEEVKQLGDYLRHRLMSMEVSLEDWCKVFPYQESPILLRVFQTLIHNQLADLSPELKWTPVPVVSSQLTGPQFRVALLAGYILYHTSARSTLSLLNTSPVPHVFSHPSRLFPYGYGVQPGAYRWHDQEHYTHFPLYELIRDKFPVAAKRREPGLDMPDSIIGSLRNYLHARMVLEGSAGGDNIAVLFLSNEVPKDMHRALEEHLRLFAGAIIVLFDKQWYLPLDLENVIYLNSQTDLVSCLEDISASSDIIKKWRKSYKKRQEKVDKELRHLQLAHTTAVKHQPQGPYNLEL